MKMVVVGFFGLFGRVLNVILPNVSPGSVSVICHLKMLATETGETLGRTTFRTQPKSPKNPQQPLDPGCESLRENYENNYKNRWCQPEYSEQSG